jgi:uncharacterized membrane protein YdjX (TVP38/TMEM64 family)
MFGMKIITERPPMVVLGGLVEIAFARCYAVVLGSTTPGIVVAQVAASAMQATGPAPAVSVWFCCQACSFVPFGGDREF